MRCIIWLLIRIRIHLIVLSYEVSRRNLIFSAHIGCEQQVLLINRENSLDNKVYFRLTKHVLAVIRNTRVQSEIKQLLRDNARVVEYAQVKNIGPYDTVTYAFITID